MAPCRGSLPTCYKNERVPGPLGIRLPYRALVALANAETPLWLTSQKNGAFISTSSLCLWNPHGLGLAWGCGEVQVVRVERMARTKAKDSRVRAAIMARNCPTDRQRAASRTVRTAVEVRKANEGLSRCRCRCRCRLRECRTSSGACWGRGLSSSSCGRSASSGSSFGCEFCGMPVHPKPPPHSRHISAEVHVCS